MQSIGAACLFVLTLTLAKPALARSATHPEPSETRSGEDRNDTNPKTVTILGLGDSITQGSTDFDSYLFPLQKKLRQAGYHFRLIGPKASVHQPDSIYNAGYGGKTAEFLATMVDSIYTRFPADVVLLHSGHNHFDTENPVAGIIAAQKSMIAKLIAINPRVVILVAQVITSGKLPKYSYIPALNQQIGEMVNQLNNRQVILVNQAKGWEWEKNTIADKVHPNARGAEKMAQAWFKALKRHWPSTDRN
ncbi:GDSL-type esterase/lipase family protein [Larkinella rosea]|nr:GDSL-type esterase/lipase family protein [Larkinella rosea]